MCDEACVYSPRLPKKKITVNIPNLKDVMASTNFDDTDHLSMEDHPPASSVVTRAQSATPSKSLVSQVSVENRKHPYIVPSSKMGKKGKSLIPQGEHSSSMIKKHSQIPVEAQISGMMAPPVSKKTQFYIIPEDMILYLTSSRPVTSASIESQLELWHKDEWENLSYIPDGLEYGHYMLCLRKEQDKSLIIRKSLSARKHFLALQLVSNSTAVNQIPLIVNELASLFQTPQIVMDHVIKSLESNMNVLENITLLFEKYAHKTQSLVMDIDASIAKLQSIGTDVHRSLSAKMNNLEAFLGAVTGKNDTNCGSSMKSTTQPKLTVEHGTASRREYASTISSISSQGPHTSEGDPTTMSLEQEHRIKMATIRARRQQLAQQQETMDCQESGCDS